MNDSSSDFGAPANGPTVYPATVDATPRSAWRLTTVALVLTLLIGGVGGGWLAMTIFGGAAVAPAAEPSAVAATPKALIAAQPTPAVQQLVAPPLTAAESGAIAARLGLLEERLSRINLAAESASGNAARAEALLVAFAARRAVERGFPLGSMEAQLRLRFGESQPNAVDSILSASANPLTADQLKQKLDDLRSVLTVDSGAGWLTQIGTSLRSLIVVRSAEEPSSRPNRRFERATHAIDNGRVDEAIIEVEAMPGHADPLAAAWLTEARRFNDARRALDLIETAAILEPGANREPTETR